MLYRSETNQTKLAGAVIAGATYLPAGDDAVYAIYRMPHLSCGVTVEVGGGQDYLRLTPSIQIPYEARDGFARFQFECDDERIVDLRFDAFDGEITMRLDLDEVSAECIERTLKPALAWIDEEMCPEIVEYIARVYADRQDD